MNKKILILIVIVYLIALFVLKDNKKAQIIATAIFAIISSILLTSIMTKKKQIQK